MLGFNCKRAVVHYLIYLVSCVVVLLIPVTELKAHITCELAIARREFADCCACGGAWVGMASGGGLAADDESRYEDGEEDEDEGEEDMMTSGRPYVPPATDRDGPKPSFGEQCDDQFIVPTRLHDKPYELIEAANDWHYAMMNDHPRNDFYRGALAKVVTSSPRHQ
jgi:hypothetical protein